MTDLASVLKRMNDIRDYENAEQTAAKTALAMGAQRLYILAGRRGRFKYLTPAAKPELRGWWWIRRSKPTKFLGSYAQAVSYLDEFVIRKNERPTGLFPPEQIGKRWYR